MTNQVSVMKEKIVEYLKSVDLTALPIIAKVEEAYDFYISIGYNKISDIFIVEYQNEKKERQYESLWFFSGEYILEVKHFMRVKDFDATNLGNNIIYWTVQNTEFIYPKATNESRLYLHFKLDNDVVGTLKASGNNCNALFDISKKYIFANLKGTSGDV